ncbi:hypothetical protein B0T10DRAFT_579236 [Thelonectria olida]|uniref:C2H2-type domain-containing protein n=1 Tax=Thelonectria olida TaxID=1576542 RepID=A0A9P8VXP8_9HYPO|nr:hypothetical protein B0T10DRAFT_579236 [Thelonectria olida]
MSMNNRPNAFLSLSPILQNPVAPQETQSDTGYLVSRAHGFRTAIHIVENTQTAKQSTPHEAPQVAEAWNAMRYVASQVTIVWNKRNAQATIGSEISKIVEKCTSSQNLLDYGIDAFETVLRGSNSLDFTSQFALVVLLQVTSRYLVAKNVLTVASVVSDYRRWMATLPPRERNDTKILFEDLWRDLTERDPITVWSANLPSIASEDPPMLLETGRTLQDLSLAGQPAPLSQGPQGHMSEANFSRGQFLTLPSHRQFLAPPSLGPRYSQSFSPSTPGSFIHGAISTSDFDAISDSGFALQTPQLSFAGAPLIPGHYPNPALAGISSPFTHGGSPSFQYGATQYPQTLDLPSDEQHPGVARRPSQQTPDFFQLVSSLILFLRYFGPFFREYSGRGMTFKETQAKEGPVPIKNMMEYFISPLKRRVEATIQSEKIVSATEKHVDRGCFNSVEQVKQYILRLAELSLSSHLSEYTSLKDMVEAQVTHWNNRALSRTGHPTPSAVPQEGGFPCKKCGRMFDRSFNLGRHEKKAGVCEKYLRKKAPRSQTPSSRRMMRRQGPEA